MICKSFGFLTVGMFLNTLMAIHFALITYVPCTIFKVISPTNQLRLHTDQNSTHIHITSLNLNNGSINKIRRHTSKHEKQHGDLLWRLHRQRRKLRIQRFSSNSRFPVFLFYFDLCCLCSQKTFQSNSNRMTSVWQCQVALSSSKGRRSTQREKKGKWVKEKCISRQQSK